MDCKKQAMAGVCVYWVKTRYLVVVRIQNTTRAAGRILIGRYVLVVPADGGKQDRVLPSAWAKIGGRRSKDVLG